ncbi:MAG: DUF3576 domain-containing protein [Ascidiaceihabitans sp.]|jgi:hypothetical protein|nr:DUF3576 domain-containing protein [Ascidiaceihabitans sp.]
MNTVRSMKIAAILVASLAVSGCSGQKIGFGALSSGKASAPQKVEEEQGSTIWDLFRKQENDNVIAVNKYIWTAAIEVLDFLPIQTIDPFTGVIATGYGTPPNGGRAYRATVLIDDPALDARSLTVALQTRGGAAPAATTRAVEDAILSRARQLRIQDGRF